MTDCPHCKKRIVKFPLFQRLDGSTDVSLKDGFDILMKRKYGKVLWRNLLRTDWWSITMIVIVLSLAWSYNHDIELCREFENDPCAYCEGTQCGFENQYWLNVSERGDEAASGQQVTAQLFEWDRNIQGDS